MRRQLFKHKLNKYIYYYIKSIENEIQIDLMNYKLLNLNPTDYSFLPRPFISTKYFKNVPKKKITKLLILFWINILSYLFLNYIFLRSFLLKLITKEQFNSIHAYNDYILGFSTRAIDIIKIEQNLNFAKIIFPDVVLTKNTKLDKLYNIYSLITYNDLFFALKLSLKSYKYIYNDPIKRIHALQNYTAYNWFLSRLVLDRLSGNFHFAEHYDRWAVLIDSTVFEKNKYNFQQISTLRLVQHGLVGLPNFENTKLHLPIKLAYKLKSVSILNVYDKKNSDLFINHIFSQKNKELTKIEYSLTKINLTKIKIEKKISLLIVGHPLFEDFHIHLFNTITNLFDLNIFYKPHPLSKPSQKILNQNWLVINQQDVYPEVDYLVSYYSTLTLEYDTYKIPSLIHSFDIHNTGEEYLIELIKLITSLTHK